MLFSRKLLLQDQIRFDDETWTTPGEYQVKLPAGVFVVTLMGGGGAGGRNAGSSGGAGGRGDRAGLTLTLTKPATVVIGVGQGGVGQGNGGSGGQTNNGGNRNGAAGGDGGRPSYIKWADPNIELTTSGAYPFPASDVWLAGCWVAGGGGGGGAGGEAQGGRNSNTQQLGGGGGGGGGAYDYNDSFELISYAGKNGGTFYPNSGWNGASGVAGWFNSEIKAGNGGWGGYEGKNNGGSGGTGGTGTGGSGGSGGVQGNHGSSSTGGGGGGAGGSPNLINSPLVRGAGGQGGSKGALWWIQGGDGSEFTTAIRKGIMPDLTEVDTGWGAGGAPNADGSDGYVRILRVV